LAFFLSLAFSSMAQSEEMDLEWYESFFLESKKQSIEQTLTQAQSNLQEAATQQNTLGEAKALNEIGLVYLTQLYDYGKAIDYLIRALAFEDSLDMKRNQIFTFLAIAQVYREAGDYDKSAQFLNNALGRNSSPQDAAVHAYILNKLGEVNAMNGKNEDAFDNYVAVLDFNDEIENPNAEALALFNLAHHYTTQGNYEEALTHHKQALAMRRKTGDKKAEAVSLNDIGLLYSLMKNGDKALANHVVALEIRQRLKDKRGEAQSYNNIGALYYEQKNFQRAAANLQLALAAAREAGDQAEIRKSYEFLSGCYEGVRDYKKALEYKNLFFAINDLIQGDKNDQDLMKKQSLYDIGQKEAEIGKLVETSEEREKDLQNERRFRNILVIVIALILIIVALIVYFYILQQRSNRVLQQAHERVNKQNLELQELNATKDKFFSIISHDLKGPLNSLTSFSGLLINHTESLSKEEIQMFARDFDKTLKNLFALLENLLEWSRSQTGNIEFKPEPFDLGMVLEENRQLLKAQAENKKITIVNENTESLIVHAHQNSVNTVVRNLISNAIKFTPDEGTITLKLKRNGADVMVSVTDTGVGMSEVVVNKLFRLDAKLTTKGTANEKGTGLGLILCKEFIEKNGGRIWVKSVEGEGSVFYFLLPMEGQANIVE